MLTVIHKARPSSTTRLMLVYICVLSGQRKQYFRPNKNVIFIENENVILETPSILQVPLMNPEAAIQEALKNLKMGSEEWNYKV